MFDKLHRIEKIIFALAAIFFVIFYCYSAVYKPATYQMHVGIYVLITYVLVFLLYKSKGIFRILDYIFIVLSIITICYWIYNFEALNYRAGAETLYDRYIGVVGVLLGIEVARRAVGKVFVLIGVVFLLYGVFGPHMPYLIAHPGGSLLDITTEIYFKPDGLFGIMPSVLATYVLLFVLFGAFLEASGAQKFFIDFPLAAVGHRVGGPAKVAVIASMLFGSISGSAIANTVSTGSFTIPLMKKAGFKPHVAGAIEPAASVGGMFMPPIMGAGGFIMAELTGVNYANIMLISIFPAIMYFFSVYVMIHYEAKMYNLRGEKSPDSAISILKREWYYILPLVVITIFMVLGYSPGYAAVLGIVTCIVISYFNKDTRIKVKEFVNASIKGTEQSLKLGATIGVIGIIISMLTYSGLILTFADIVIDLANGKLFLTILFIALASLILGMGVPVTAAYLITAVVAVPALTALGVNQVAAHMIVYWLSQDSNITPPVCIAAFAGATIAKANPWLTAINSFKFAKFLYLAPFLFGYVPAFSLNDSPKNIIIWFISIAIIVYLFSYVLSFVWIPKVKKIFAKA